MRAVALKYFEVARTNLRSTWAYLWNQVLSSVYLIIIMFVFVQLWKVTYAAQGKQISGYSLAEMLWYVTMTEAIIFSLPRVHQTIEAEVKSGDLALRLNKPYNYLLFHYFAFAGEGVVRMLTALTAGGLTTYLMVGGFDIRWQSLPLMAVILILTQALHFCTLMLIGLAAFWMEDVTGLYFVFDKIKWILGGLMLPLDIFPDLIRKIAMLLPFKEMLYAPARLFVKFGWVDGFRLIGVQVLWLIVFGAVCWGVYRLGERRVDINGG